MGRREYIEEMLDQHKTKSKQVKHQILEHQVKYLRL